MKPETGSPRNFWKQAGAVRLLLVSAIGLGLLHPAPAQASPPAAPLPGPCVPGTLPGGGLSLICIPASGWNGDLVVFAHGYVAYNQPLDFYHLALPDGTSLPALVQGLGFAFATTSYRQNGLAILEGVEDVRELVAAFRSAHGVPGHTYLTGVSEGGILTALLVERYPELFSGGLSACGPIGDFRQQINYLGDFRVLFDYFFPGGLPAGPTSIPQSVIDNWEGTYVPAITARLAASPSAAAQLINTARAAVDPADPSTLAATTINVLWYNVFGTNDGKAKLGGSPFDNRSRWYFGSNNDLRLNLRVQRFQASATALARLAGYQTSGRLTIPLVTLHTTGDEIIPFWHQILYAGKVQTSGRGSFLPIPIFRYGHCNFTAAEVLAAFGLLILQATGSSMNGLSQTFEVDQVRLDFAQAKADFVAEQQAAQSIQNIPPQFKVERLDQ
jgi:pimeloyl-ACP methyl ester carboxylesterase